MPRCEYKVLEVGRVIVTIQGMIIAACLFCVYGLSRDFFARALLTVKGLDIPGSPFLISALGSFAGRCEVFGDGLSGGIVGEVAAISVKVPADATKEEAKLQLKIKNPSGVECSFSSLDKKNQTDFSFTPSIQGIMKTLEIESVLINFLVVARITRNRAETWG